jgi:hypothetical protein
VWPDPSAQERPDPTRVWRCKLASLQGVLVKIQPQVTLPLLSVRSVALEAMLRENRSDIAIEGQRFGGQLGLGIAPMADQDHGQCKAQ